MEKRSIRLGISFIMNMIFLSPLETLKISIRSYKASRKNHKGGRRPKNKSFKDSGFRSKRRVAPKFDFKKSFSEESRLLKGKGFSSLLGIKKEVKEEIIPFKRQSIIEGRVPRDLKGVLSKLYGKDQVLSTLERYFSKEEFISLKESMLKGFTSPNKFSTILDKDSMNNEGLDTLPKDPEVEKNLLDKISLIEEKFEKLEDSPQVVGGVLKISGEKYMEENERIKSLRSKIESETKRDLPVLVDISIEGGKGLSTFSYYKSELFNR